MCQQRCQKKRNRLVNQAVLVKQFLYSEMFMFVMLSCVVWLSDVIPSIVQKHGVSVSVHSWHDKKNSYNNTHHVKLWKNDTSSEYPKFVILLAYQRSGSTFSGNMFNLNKDMLYIYEPLAAVYNHLYASGCSTMDVHYEWNATERKYPIYEKAMVAEHIKQIFTCQFEDMISEFLMHVFWKAAIQLQAEPYTKCLQKYKILGYTSCEAIIQGHCPTELGKNVTGQEYCHTKLSANNYINVKTNINQENIIISDSNLTEDIFYKYKLCMEEKRQIAIEKCVPILKDICKSKSVRVIKTVRLNRDSALALKEIFPNMKIVHMTKNPKGVMNSRIKAPWSMSHGTNSFHFRSVVSNKNAENSSPNVEPFEHHSSSTSFYSLPELKEKYGVAKSPGMYAIQREAYFYCELMRKDALKLADMETLFPGSTYTLVFEDLLSDPVTELANVYSLLGEEVPVDVIAKIKASTANSHGREKVWENLPSDVISLIDNTCKLLYRELGNPW